MAEEKTTKKVVKKAPAKKPENSNIKAYKILAYLGILWIVGLLVPEKNDKSLRFHVGQGIILTIFYVVVGLINNLLIANIFVRTYTIWGYTYKMISGFGVFVQWLLYLIPTALCIVGIVNVVKGKDKELPVIGKLSFYK